MSKIPGSSNCRLKGLFWLVSSGRKGLVVRVAPNMAVGGVGQGSLFTAVDRK